MRKRTKVMAIVIAITVAAAIAVTGGVVLAAGPHTNPTTTPAVTNNSPSDTFLSNLAAKLGISVDDLQTDITQARNDTLDQLVTNGTITSAQKDWIESRIQQAQQNGYGPGFGPCLGSGFGPGAMGFGRGPFNGGSPSGFTPPFGGTPPWNQTTTTTSG